MLNRLFAQIQLVQAAIGYTAFFVVGIAKLNPTSALAVSGSCRVTPAANPPYKIIKPNRQLGHY